MGGDRRCRDALARDRGGARPRNDLNPHYYYGTGSVTPRRSSGTRRRARRPTATGTCSSGELIDAFDEPRRRAGEARLRDPPRAPELQGARHPGRRVARLARRTDLAWIAGDAGHPDQHRRPRRPHADGAADPPAAPEDAGGEVFAKLEMYNPGGSVKDRIGVAMIEAAEAEGRIEPGRTTIVEATSGNTGIALAFVCAAKGYDLILTLPQGMSREREGLLRLYGAQVHVTESLGGMNEAVAAAQALARDGDVWLPDQFANPANPEAHRRTTGPELWEAMDGRIDYLVAGVGTGGTITGAGSLPEGAQPGAAGRSPSSPRARRVLSGGRPGPHKIQGIGAGVRPARARPRAARRDHRRRRRGRARDRAPGRPPRGRAGRDLLRRGAVGGDGDRAPARGARPADRGDPARLGRALRLDAVLRAGARARPAAA